MELDFPELELSRRHPVLASEDELLAECVRELAIPNDYREAPYWETPVGSSVFATRLLVCGLFFKRSINKTINFQIPRHLGKDFKQRCNTQAELMSQIWHIAQLLPLSYSLRPLVFYEIIKEESLIFFQFGYEEKGGDAITVTEWIKIQQKINRNLQSTEKNPFEEELEPETWRFIEQAREKAQRSQDFSSYYQKLIHARMAVVSVLRQSKTGLTRLNQSGKKENRGKENRGKRRKQR